MRVLAWLFLAVGPAAAFHPIAPAPDSQITIGCHRQHGSHRVAADRLKRVGHPTLIADSPAPEPIEELGKLSMSLELAVRTENYAEAARLKDQIAAVEAANPTQALRWRQQQKVEDITNQALLPGESLDTRKQAVQSLMNMAFPPASPGAQDALHEILLDVKGQDAEVVREAVDDALWSVWLQSGDDETDAALNKGVRLMQGERLKEAEAAFTEVIRMAPDFAEAWNKRATVYFLMKDYNRSIDDCMQVLKLNPRHFGCLSGLGMCHLSNSDIDDGMKWLKTALDVHPGLKSARQMITQAILERYQKPEIDSIIKAMIGGSLVKIRPGENVSVDWDVHRTLSEEEGINPYLVRLQYKNKSPKACTFRIVSRYYVVQFADGEVFPFVRLVEDGSEAKFTLAPGEEYKFCWHLLSPKQVKGLVGGTLFEVLDESGKPMQEYTMSGHELLDARKADEIAAKDKEQLTAGYVYYGALDLRAFGK